MQVLSGLTQNEIEKITDSLYQSKFRARQIHNWIYLKSAKSIDDMTDLRNYIADVLDAPKPALAYIRTIRKEIGSLTEMPARYKPVDDEPWHSRSVRRLLVKNSFVYYRMMKVHGRSIS